MMTQSALHARVVERPRVVLVHGIFQTGRNFFPLVKKLEASGCECLVPRLKPRDARGGIEPLAEQLDREVNERWGSEKKIHIVAHSMGGIVSRYYLQNMGGAKRCVSFSTCATPHYGTHIAWLYPGVGAAQLRRNSDFLKTLNANDEGLKHVRIQTFRTPFDVIILPSSSSDWAIAENHICYAPVHPFVVYAPSVQKKIMEVIFSEPR